MLCLDLDTRGMAAPLTYCESGFKSRNFVSYIAKKLTTDEMSVEARRVGTERRTSLGPMLQRVGAVRSCLHHRRALATALAATLVLH